MTKKTTSAKPAPVKPASTKPATKAATTSTSAKPAPKAAPVKPEPIKPFAPKWPKAGADAKRMAERASELEAAARKPRDVAGPAAVRMPDGAMKMVDKDMDDAVKAALSDTLDEAEGGTDKRPTLASVPAVAKPPPEKVKTVKLGDPEMVQIEARIFAAALHCAAKGDVRYYLNGVHVFEHHAGVLRIEATNGHVLFVNDYPVEKVPAWAKGRGVIISRDNLGKAIAAAGKDDAAVLNVSTGLHHTHVTVATWPDQWASFRLELVEGNWPDTEKIAEGAMGTLANEGERMPLDTTAIAAEYFGLATSVAKALDIPGVQAYMGDGKSAAVFTFGIRRAALFVMPIRDGGNLTVQAASVLAPALSRSLGALKAHQTRNEQAAKDEKDPELSAELRNKAKAFANRIKELMSAANESKALPAPEKKAA
jgi:hypothetical protein